ncbi:helix-turn-helix domain-containing protein [Streptomyces sp. NPDC097640]|uniref:helix-turn-helix domain-containing protein n=1 Tax=Streptomyces sp. NPDC097640 TaxID=3157229 RepID=UPI0033213405
MRPADRGLPRPESETDAVLALLELLAGEAPPDRIRQVSRGHARTERLERAERLAHEVHAHFARRQQRESELSALVDIARDLTLPYDLDALLRTITRRTRTLLKMDMSYVSFRDRERGDSYVRTADGHASALTVGYRVPSDAGVGEEATDKSVPIWTPDYLADDGIRHTAVLDEVVRAEGLRAIIAAPLTYGAETFGVLYAADRNIRHFSVGEVALMSSLGDLAALAIEKTRTLERRHSDVEDLTEFRSFGEVHSRLIDLALAGVDLDTLLTEVAAAFDGAAEVRDTEHRRLATVGELPPVDEAEVPHAAGTAYGNPSPVPTPVRVAASSTWLAPVTAGDEELAELRLRPGEPLNEAGVRRLRLAAQAVAVLLQVQRGEEAAAGPFRDELFEDLLAVTRRPLKQLALRAARLGLDPEQPAVVVVVRPEGGTTGRAVGWAASYARRKGGLRSVQNGCISLLLPVPADDPAEAAGRCARAVSEELSRHLGEPVTVGAGGPVRGLELIREAHAEATRCLDALLALGNIGSAACVRDLGFLGMLLSDDSDANTFVMATIGPVLEYDAQRLTELTRTLDTYFAAGGSPTNAAEQLHVHPNTVSRRLERVAALLGPDWSRPDRALEMQLALRLHHTRHVLRRRHRTDRAASTATEDSATTASSASSASSASPTERQAADLTRDTGARDGEDGAAARSDRIV